MPELGKLDPGAEKIVMQIIIISALIIIIILGYKSCLVKIYGD